MLLTPELVAELRPYTRSLGEERLLAPAPGAKSGKLRVDKSFATLLKEARIADFCLAKQHVANTGTTAREIWTLMDAPVEAEAGT